MPAGRAAGLGAALLLGWAVSIPLLVLYADQTGSGGTDLALALGALAAGLLWPRIAAIPSLTVQLMFALLLILPFLLMAMLVVVFVAMVIREIIGLMAKGFGVSLDGGSHQIGADAGGIAISFLLCFSALRVGIALSQWGRG